MCYDLGLCGNGADLPRVKCDEANSLGCLNNKCRCKDGFTGTKCDKRVVSAPAGSTPTQTKAALAAQYAVTKALPTDDELTTAQKQLASHISDIVTAEARKPTANIPAITIGNSVEVQPRDMSMRQRIVIRDINKKPLIAGAPDINDDDDCDPNAATYVPSERCATLDLADIGVENIVFLQTAPRPGAWSILVKGGRLVSKQTRTGDTAFDMQCWDRGWTAKIPTKDGDILMCNGFVIMIGSQAPICQGNAFDAAGNTIFGTCGEHGECQIDGVSFVCKCDSGYGGQFCEERFTVPTHCHSIDCSNYGGHSAHGIIQAGTSQDSLIDLCCIHPTRKAFDDVCNNQTKAEDYTSLGCCHRTFCI